MSDSDDDKPLGMRTIAPSAGSATAPAPAPAPAPLAAHKGTSAVPDPVPASKPAEIPSKPVLKPKPVRPAPSDSSDDDLPLTMRRPSAGESTGQPATHKREGHDTSEFGLCWLDRSYWCPKGTTQGEHLIPRAQLDMVMNLKNACRALLNQSATGA